MSTAGELYLPRTLKLTISYDGHEYHGWQVQPGASTVQGVLAAAIESVTGERLLPQGSGRTDAGVHALAQVASFETESPIPLENFRIVLNDRLPPAIRVLRVEEAAAGFHARHSARAKSYEYRIYRGDICPPFLVRYVTHYPYPLDERLMAEAAAAGLGQHDFTSFAAADPTAAKGFKTRTRPRPAMPATCAPSSSRGSERQARSADLSRARRRLSAPHGPQSGGNAFAGWQGNSRARRHAAHPGAVATAPPPGPRLQPADCFWSQWSTEKQGFKVSEVSEAGFKVSKLQSF